jgi:hypothetical protein
VIATPWFANSQTTQSVLVGTVTDSLTGQPIRSASVTCVRDETREEAAAYPRSGGGYAFAWLSPGRYTVTVRAPAYQTAQARALDIVVAGRVQLNFRLRPTYDLWESLQSQTWVAPETQQTASFYGPDVDVSRVAVFSANLGRTTPLESSRSDVISSIFIDSLPLIGRDVYTMLLLLPGVTADTATARGLGFSVNGQRPSSSNFLLDGAENNSLLVTGPLTAAVPEFIQEYRVSTSSFSAEYGRTSGFITNAITRSGTNQLHATGFFYFKNEVLNANGFQENAQGIARAPLAEYQPGVFLSGPAIRRRLYWSTGFQDLHSHSRSDPQLYNLPTQDFVASTAPDSYAGKLLRQYAIPNSPAGPGDSALMAIAPSADFSRSDGLARVDGASRSGSQHFYARLVFDRLREPALLPSAYSQFSNPYSQNALALSAGILSHWGATASNEFRASRTGDSEYLASPHSEVPIIQIDEGTSLGQTFYPVVMPGAPSLFNYRNRGRNWEFLDNWTWIRGPHVLKGGAGLLQRNVDLEVAVYPGGKFEFPTLSAFAAGTPSYLYTETDVVSGAEPAAPPQRAYRYRQSYAFAQDSFHLSRHVTFDVGLRYEHFGWPLNTGAQKDDLLQFGAGSSIQDRIASATEALPSISGSQAVYSARPSNWAVRAGAAWDVTGTAKTIVRAAYGIFYDRLFDNLWQNVIQNRYQTQVYRITQPVDLSSPLSQTEASATPLSTSQDVNSLAFQPELRSPRVQSAMMTVQRKLTRSLMLEAGGLASKGRQLITTDVVNRVYSTDSTEANPFGLLNPSLGDIDYRANQGSSDYAAATATLRFRTSRLSGQVSYTLSHSIDNQSEALAGTFFDYNQFGNASKPSYTFISSFTQQFASRLDRGNSDFDQRHNLVFFATYQLPRIATLQGLSAVTSNWAISTLGAVRSGLPFSVYAPPNSTVFPPEDFVNQRADLVLPAKAYASSAAPGGKLLLNAQAFANPGPNTIGSSGRNEFTGPGLMNIDLSLARTLRIPHTPESSRLTIRVDFYNVLNHANLNNPDSFLGSPTFGLAQYGRIEVNTGFPLLAPLNETARQVHVMLRFQF